MEVRPIFNKLAFSWRETGSSCSSFFPKAELRIVKKSSVAILKESKSSWQFSRVEIMPGKHSVSFLVKQVINTGMAGKRVGYREPIKNIDYELHASRSSNTPFDGCY